MCAIIEKLRILFISDIYDLIVAPVLSLTTLMILLLISGTRKQAKGKTVAEISKIRDEFLLNLQKMRKKYENKIRK